MRRSSFTRCFVLCAVAAGIGAPLAAQSPTLPPAGARVRLDTRDGRRVVGTVTAVDGDTIHVSPWVGKGAPSHAVPVAAVRAYRVGGGQDRGRGARRGALVGAAIGAGLVGLGFYWDVTAGHTISYTAVAVPTALVVTGAGALIGRRAAPTRWGAPVTVGLGGGGHRGRAVHVGARF